MARTAELFEKPPRRKARVLMHMTDAGCNCSGPGEMAKFECPRCGHDSGWMNGLTSTEIRRGIPCPECNK